ncbi:MAG TPA: putative baseplate assembly protein, partial [Longimicrobiaceae bacterium]|nr:putative baseplate assembly protein [Longimicrobiaceae bacterium]
MSDGAPAADCRAQLDACGCAPDAAAAESAASSGVENPPGQAALAYRAGTHPTFLERMLRRLVSQTVPPDDPDGPRPLARLTTRAADDPAIALLDAWATTADVLTFYQERIANEGFLRTATERRSVLELARTIGYELGPGVAASTPLAFTLESARAAPLTTATVVPAVLELGEGLKVQSVPGPGERAQVFETVEVVEARPEWNLLYPRLTRPQGLELGEDELWLDGIQTGLQPGDALLLVGRERESWGGSENWDFRFVVAVEPDADAGRTRVRWTEGLGFASSTRRVEPADDPRAYAFRARGSFFGYNAPDWRAMPDTLKAAFDPAAGDLDDEGRYTGSLTQWPGFEYEGADEVVDLDTLYPKVLPDSWIVLEKSNYTELYRVTRARPAARTDFTLTARLTRLELDAYEHLSWFPRRATVVHLQSEELALTEAPDPALVGGDEIELDRLVDGLEEGRTLVFSGRRRRARVDDGATDLVFTASDGTETALRPGEVLWMLAPATDAGGGSFAWSLVNRFGVEGTATAGAGEIGEEDADEADVLLSESATLAEATDDGVRTTLRLEAALTRWYDRGSLRIWANVAHATHGETVREVLGSGDGSQPNQSFTLKRPPLTYVSAATASGTESTLEVRVNDLLWSEVPSFFEAGPQSEVYTVRHADDGTATVAFGDGIRGARLPTGQANVTATYRTGTGPDGEVDAGTLTLLQTRPLGLKEVTNPLAASGAAAPEALEDARANAPLTVLTLDRIVSVQDFEDFARAFAGIGKARAVALWSGERQVVHLTVASASGGEVATDSDLHENLTAAIDAYREGSERVVLASYTPRTFRLAAGLRTDPRFVAADVLADAAAALRAAFSFEARAFAQPVSGAEVIAALQGVPG